jgi:hypothetical protein
MNALQHLKLNLMGRQQHRQRAVQRCQQTDMPCQSLAKPCKAGKTPPSCLPHCATQIVGDVENVAVLDVAATRGRHFQRTGQCMLHAKHKTRHSTSIRSSTPAAAAIEQQHWCCCSVRQAAAAAGALPGAPAWRSARAAPNNTCMHHTDPQQNTTCNTVLHVTCLQPRRQDTDPKSSGSTR